MTIFVLNYLISRQLERKGGKMVATFIDLKAAFDSVDRRVLVKTLGKSGVRGGVN